MAALNIKGIRGPNPKAIKAKSINAKHPLANINSTHTLPCDKTELYQLMSLLWSTKMSTNEERRFGVSGGGKDKKSRRK